MSKVQSKSKKQVELEEDSSSEEEVQTKKQVKTNQAATKAKAPATKKKVEESEEESSEEEIIKPTTKGKTAQKAVVKAAVTKAKKPESDDESEESSLEDAPVKGKKPAAVAAKNGKQSPAQKQVPAKKAATQVVEEDSDESEEAPKTKAKPAAKTAQPAKGKKAAVESSSEEESEEEVKPKGKGAKAQPQPAKKATPKATPQIDDSVSDDEESDDVPQTKGKAKPAAVATQAKGKANQKKVVEESDEESDEESTPKAQPKKAAAVTKKPAKQESEEEDEEEEEVVKSAKATPVKQAQTGAAAGIPDDGNYEVIIKGLPFQAADHDVKEYFAEAGEIANVNLLKGPDGRSKGIAFVRYTDNNGLAKALSYSGENFGGRQIVVEKTTPKGQRNDAPQGGRGGFGGANAGPADFAPKSERDPNSASIFVGNLSWGTDENSLAAFFESCGNVQNVRIARDPEGKARGFGHVDFASPDAVEKAVAKAGQNLDGRPVRVDYATSKKQDGGRGGFGGGGRGGFGGGFGGGRGGFGGGVGGPRMNLGEEDANKKKGSISSFQGSKQRL